jgi:hypothetical protein
VLGDASVQVDVEGATPIGYHVKGKYKPTADTSNLKLASDDPALKTSVALKSVELEAGGAVAGTVAFKIAGQKGKAELPTSALVTGFCARTPCGPVVDGGALNLLFGGIETPYVPPSNGFDVVFY